MRIAIVEDEEKAKSQLIQMVESYGKEKEIGIIIDSFKDGLQFIEQYKPVYDAVFMDIEMPYIDGLEASKRLRTFDSSVNIIFVTNLKQFALRGYEVNALDFLVKPVMYPILKVILDKIQRKIITKGKEIVVVNQKGVYRIKTNDIIYVEILNHYVTYHTVDKEISFYGNLSEEFDKLPKELFALCNSCYIVNLSYISKIENDSVYVNNIPLKISRHKKASLMNALSQLLSRS